LTRSNNPEIDNNSCVADSLSAFAKNATKSATTFNFSGDSCLIASLSRFCISVTGIVEDLSTIGHL
jgi:hypothetical protein